MTPTRHTTIRLEDEIRDALQRIKDRVGIPVSEQIRRAMLGWIKDQGETVKPARRGARTPRKA